ncbi:hypothetical protein MTO98_20885 [Mucilaginibacter sp. SMC90]|uniref:hypothetical protein n=1 Tax=Mucilaginibacter sp. SMC90 TaxID=2929803 RepID=UPI001FB27CE2|nr:hypothetical protein [Mucilaginibacter sp. SMC90]UOE46862.1 hypothetical protein MTO98_20885 [Mucilaginibacter sp. SMC90]
MIDLSNVLLPLRELLLTTKVLKDKDLMADETPIALKTDGAESVNIQGVTFTIGAGAGVSVKLFNDEDDKDEDEFVGVKDAPIIFNSESEAYLKYTNAITAKLDANLPIASAGFDLALTSEGNAKSVFYKKHANTDIVNAAFLQDIIHYHTIFDPADIEDLDEDDALAFLVTGSLSSSIKISWSDIFSSSLSLLAGILPVPVTLDLSLTPSLMATVNFSVKDDFRYFIKKLPNKECLVIFKKGKATSTGVSAGAAIQIGLTNSSELENQLEELYEKIIESVFGHTANEIDTALQKIKGGVADADQEEMVKRLLIYFKLDKVPDSINTLIAKIAAIKTIIPDKIKAIANASLDLSFSYQYKRLTEENEILSVKLPTKELIANNNYHKDLLKFKLTGLLDDLRDSKVAGAVVNSYLNEKKITVSKSWGFGLQLFDFNLLGKDYTDLKDVVRTNLGNTAQQISMERVLGYKWGLGKPAGSWKGLITADMAGYSKQAIPAIDEFDISMLINQISENTRLDEDGFRDLIDLAVLWGAIKVADVTAVVTKYLPKVNVKDKKVLTEHKLLFSPAAFKLLMQTISSIGWSGLNLKYLAMAMGASMTYISDYQLRRDPAARQQTYGGLWLGYLNDFDPDTDPGDFAAAAEEVVRNMGNPDHLAQFEADPGNWIFGDTYAGVIRSNPSLQSDLKDFILGIQNLNNAVQQHSQYTSFNNAYKKISGVFSQSFSLRTIGNFLMLYARDLNILSEMSQVFTITIDPDGDTPEVVNFSII